MIDGPPPAHTGGFGEPTCQVCHLGSELNGPGSTLEVIGLGGRFIPGRSCALTIRLSSFDMYAAGFQAAIRYAEGDRRGQSAGELRSVDDRTRVVAGDAGVHYASHTRAGTTVTGDEAEWSFMWRAPPEAVRLSLDVAANSGNGDNSPLDDLVYAQSLELDPAPPAEFASTASCREPSAPAAPAAPGP
jgi:hypothetical protein